MDRARDADVLWGRAEHLFNEAPWAFDPASLVARSLTALSDVLRRFGVSQRHTLDAAAWRTIAEALMSPLPAVDPVRIVIAQAEGTVTDLHSAIRR
jgi:hypothetical protein